MRATLPKRARTMLGETNDRTTSTFVVATSGTEEGRLSTRRKGHTYALYADYVLRSPPRRIRIIVRLVNVFVRPACKVPPWRRSDRTVVHRLQARG